MLLQNTLRIFYKLADGSKKISFLRPQNFGPIKNSWKYYGFQISTQPTTSLFECRHKSAHSTSAFSNHLKLRIPNSELGLLYSPVSNFYYSTKSDNGSVKNQEDEKESTEIEKLSLFQRFKKMSKDYWYVLFPVHIATSIVWYGSFYFAVKSGVDLASLLENIGCSETIVKPLRNNSGAGYFALAYAMYKIATPARYAVTLGGTTVSIKYLHQFGIIKPMPSRDRMKEIYNDKKEEFQKKKSQAIHNLKAKQNKRH